MADIIKELVSGVVETVVKELLKKSHGRTSTKRKKRQTRSAATGRFTRSKTPKQKAPARKQVSRRRTAASRSKQRTR